MTIMRVVLSLTAISLSGKRVGYLQKGDQPVALEAELSKRVTWCDLRGDASVDRKYSKERKGRLCVKGGPNKKENQRSSLQIPKFSVNF